MSLTEATRRANLLKNRLEARGVETRIALLQGRPGTPNNRWYDKRFIGSMGHHIVSSRTQGLTPGYNLVRVGRSDVPGPLCNAYLGFDGIARIICMGWANHPGAGGPYTLPGGTIPKDTARPYLFGWEIEGGIRESDWPASFRVIMGKCHAATLDFLGKDERSHIEHKTWAPSRKVDRLNYTLAKARAELKPWLTVKPPPVEDEVELTDKINLKGSDGKRYWAGNIMNTDDISVAGALSYGAAALWLAKQRFDATDARLVALQTLVESVVGNDPGNTLSKEDVKEVIETAIRDNVVKVDVTIQGEDTSDV